MSETPAFDVKKKAFGGLVFLALLLWLALFIPAGDPSYWQGWVYWAVFMASVMAISLYFFTHDLTLIQNRLKVGPGAEVERGQKVAQVLIGLFFMLLVLVPSFDHRFGWSHVPAQLALVGDCFVVLGLSTIFLVFRENSYASASVEVSRGQRVISTGPYGIVRHPMYVGALVMLFFTPLALGSFWGLVSFFPLLLVVALRLLAEERFLLKNLAGYDEYLRKVRYRLIPFVW